MKRLISILISLLILGLIYTRIDLTQLFKIFQNSDPVWMGISLGMVVPLTLLTAWRLQQLVPSEKSDRSNSKKILSFGEANRLILVASVLNLVLPSKMGDLAKAYFIKQRGHLTGSLALALVIFEKSCDMLSLLVWCCFGLILYPHHDFLFWVMTAFVSSSLVIGILFVSFPPFTEIFFKAAQKILPLKLRLKIRQFQHSWQEMYEYFWVNKTNFIKISSLSIVIWLGHLLQIWFFILALKAWTPFLANLALSPLAILAGLLPLTFAGVGTRDAALVFFYQPYFSAPTAAALGLLCTSRYVLPALGGLPFVGQYLTSKTTAKKFREALKN